MRCLELTKCTQNRMSPRRGSSLPPELPSRTDEVSSANDIDQFEDYEHNERKAGQENDSDNVILVSDLPEKQTPSKNFDASLGAQREESKKNMVVMSTIDEGASITAQNSVSDNDTCENKTGSNKHSGKVESGIYHDATLMQSTNGSQSSEWPIAVTSIEKLDAPTLRQNLEFAIGRMESMTKLTTEVSGLLVAY